MPDESDERIRVSIYWDELKNHCTFCGKCDIDNCPIIICYMDEYHYNVMMKRMEDKDKELEEFKKIKVLNEQPKPTEHFPIIKHDSKIVTCLVCGMEYTDHDKWKEAHKPCKDCYIPSCVIHDLGQIFYCENGSHFRNQDDWRKAHPK